MSVERLQRMVEDGVEQGLYRGVCYRVFSMPGQVLASGAAGQVQEGGPEASLGTVWDLASLTKPVATATSVLILAAEGAFHLDEEISRFLPGESPHLAGITLRHCLTHTSGFPAWEALYGHGWTRAEIVRRVQTQARVRPIGRGYEYSDFNYILLGEAVATAAGQSLPELAAERIFQPLGMADTTYCPPKAWSHRIAATYCGDRQRVLIGEVHDGNCDALGGVAGHAGLFGSLPDLETYGRMLLNLGEWGGTRVLSPLAVRQMMRNQNPPGMNGHTMGWFIRPNGFLPAADFLPEDTFGHTGFTGTSLLLCPSLGAGVILLTNWVCQQRDAGDFLRFRRRFHNAVAALLA